MAFTARRFQSSKQLEAAGRNSPALGPGSNGEAVEILQQALIDLGFRMPISTARSGLPDGIFGAETQASARAFQSRNGLTPDGVVGRVTLARLDVILALREKAERSKMTVDATVPAPLSPWFLT